MEKVKKSPQDDFFGRRLEGSETPFYTVRIHGYWGKGYHLSSTRYLDFPEEIVSAMRLEVGNSVRWKGEGNSLVMTPLPESVITTKLYSGLQYIATSLPVNMMSASGLKRGDYVSLKIEDGCLRVRKTEWAGQDTVKISGSGGGEGTKITILAVIAEELKIDAEKVERGVWVLWRFDEEGLFGKFQNRNPHIEKILQYNRDGARQLCANISSELGEWIRNNDDVILQIKNGKLYATKKE